MTWKRKRLTATTLSVQRINVLSVAWPIFKILSPTDFRLNSPSSHENYPPHLNYVSTLPCEMSKFKTWNVVYVMHCWCAVCSSDVGSTQRVDSRVALLTIDDLIVDVSYLLIAHIACHISIGFLPTTKPASVSLTGCPSYCIGRRICVFSVTNQLLLKSVVLKRQ